MFLQTDRCQNMKRPEGNSWFSTDIARICRRDAVARSDANYPKKKITRSEGYLKWINPAVLNQIKQRHRFQTRLFPLNLNYATCCKGEKTHPSCFTSNLSKAAWLQCERRRVRLFQLGSRGRAAFHSDAPYSAKTQGHCMVYKDAPAHSKYINQPVD